MTRERLDRGNAYVKRIERLKNVLDVFEDCIINMDDSLTRRTEFHIFSDKSSSDFRHNIDQSELMFLTEAIKSEIAILERELERL